MNLYQATCFCRNEKNKQSEHVIYVVAEGLADVDYMAQKIINSKLQLVMNHIINVELLHKDIPIPESDEPPLNPDAHLAVGYLTDFKRIGPVVKMTVKDWGRFATYLREKLGRME
jgi:hypothetical protein